MLARTRTSPRSRPRSPRRAPISDPSPRSTGTTTSSTQRFLVRFGGPAPTAISAASGGRVIGRLDHLNVLVVDGVVDPSKLAAEPGVVRVEQSIDLQLPPQTEAVLRDG